MTEILNMQADKPTLGNSLMKGNGGYELVLAALILGAIGYWLDGRLGTRPIAMLALGLVGFVGAGISLFYRFKETIAQLNAETEKLRAATND